ncbi:hypothetical protein GCM10009769_00010 [Curtobacterium luteum]|uniref:Uncharacterized protein n=1 Tax=Curtobacterium luteum TaxID=33881 RepID=A0A8H9G5W9_9MICO|nr:hypothetical protein GCM10009769_00010 [Curtobacterium luteum]
MWRAYAQLKSAVRIRPTWGVPVGLGQKRTRTSEPEAVVNGAVMTPTAYRAKWRRNRAGNAENP